MAAGGYISRSSLVMPTKEASLFEQKKNAIKEADALSLVMPTQEASLYKMK